MDSLLKSLAGLSAFVAGLFALFIYGKKQGEQEVEKHYEIKLKEEELANEFKKEVIHNEILNADLDSLVASNNDKYGSKPK